MIDLHCHIMPGIDDGSTSIETTTQMLDLAVEDGFKGIVVTPHRFNGVHEIHAVSKLQETMEMTQSIAGDRLKLFLGCELRFTHDLIKNVFDTKLAPTINGGSYILVEFPTFVIPPNTEDVLFELQSGGVTPIIAHPERNRMISHNPSLFYRLVDKGAFGQINGGSVLGRFGTEAKRTSEILIKNGLGHFLSSDAHNMAGRKPKLTQAVQVVGQLIGAEAAHKMAYENPQAVVEDRPLPFIPESKDPGARKKGGILSFFFRQNRTKY
ncbi:MAG TPA: CpsB/CapC family capsule biosynthesis tyrosine phosphatase [Blastocatellia bacterium]|nr:CpsB/CapC family capsule biosynthesis tyrosine phosphatase [Blastocatellia bacterium]